MNSSSPTAVDVDVVVVGAGPVGLSTALQLGRAGASVRVLERRPTHSHLPRAHIANARSMEIFRGWGIADGVRADGLPSELARAVAWLTSMHGEEFARIENLAGESGGSDTPESLCSCPQDRIEQRLRAAIASLPSVSLDLGHEVVGYRELDGGAEVQVRRADGSTEQVRARYAVAADGGRSSLRSMAGIELDVAVSVRRMLSIYFHAELSEYTRRRPFMLWFVHNERTQGITITVDGTGRWVYSVNVASDAAAGDFSDDYCLELIRSAVGVPDLEPEIQARTVWDQDMAVARAFRVGPLFFAGDSAHRFPPSGGFGMNTGLQDSHNLGWKMALVLSGRADESLLDTYEGERRPVAMINAKQSMANAKQLIEGDAMLNHPETLRLLAVPEGAGLRAQIAAGIGSNSKSFSAPGQTFGYIYGGPGIIDDGSPPRPSTIDAYVPTARPGARAPHVWLRDSDGGRVTTIDLVAGGFTILADTEAEPWQMAAAAAATAFSVDVRTFVIAPTAPSELVDAEAPGTWREAYELGQGGAVLVRPDGHVLARWACLPDDPSGRVANALSVLLRSAVTQTEQVAQ